MLGSFGCWRSAWNIAAWVAPGTLALALCPGLVRAEAPPACDQRYAISATLDPNQHVLTGREHIHFQNCSRAPLRSLLFHLYMNAFRDEQSVFMREGGKTLRNGALGRPGRVVVSALRTAAGLDLLPGSNPELIPHDTTQLQVSLPSALPPGAALDLDLTFRTELPEIVARAGFERDFHMLGQWFPKLARLEDSGELAGFPYHGLGEFYADFADYSFDITVPAAYGVAASGVLVHSERHANRRTDHFVAQHVHDVAWAASAHFEVREFQAGHVQLELFAPRGYGAAIERQARLVQAALPYFEHRYGAYAYPKLTVVIPPVFAERAAGMEYPTLFASDGPFWAMPAFAPDPQHDVVTAHELAHQWFSGMIASDEVTYPILDEGLAEWASLDFLRSYYRTSPSWFARHAEPFAVFDVLAAMFAWHTAQVPSSLLPATQYQYETLGRAIYMRPPLVLEAIATRFGRDKLEAALALYAREQRFRHPTLTELFGAFDAVFGAGFSDRVLQPVLAGDTPLPLQPARRPAAVSGASFLPELLLLAQTLLHWVGA